MRRRLAAGLGALAATAALVACGVPDDGAPRLITGQALEPTSTTPSTPWWSWWAST